MLKTGERLNNSIAQTLTETEEFLMEASNSSKRATQIAQVGVATQVVQTHNLSPDLLYRMLRLP